jgi:hypothetical protein
MALVLATEEDDRIPSLVSPAAIPGVGVGVMMEGKTVNELPVAGVIICVLLMLL